MDLDYQTDHIQSDIKDYFEYIHKKHSENVDNPSKLKIVLHLKLKMDIMLNF